MYFNVMLLETWWLLFTIEIMACFNLTSFEKLKFCDLINRNFTWRFLAMLMQKSFEGKKEVLSFFQKCNKLYSGGHGRNF